jgi:hypothetical protein
MFDVSTFDPKTLSWWFDERESIDFDPPYQRRGNIWSELDKQFLIDSILNGYDIPKVYVADFAFGNSSLNKTGKQYAVIDGKQRLNAIFDFFAGRLVLADDFVWSKDPSLKLGGLSFKDLLSNHPKVASKFANNGLTVMRVITDEEPKINELFVRLNKGKALTGAELRNAMKGVVPGYIRSIGEHDFFKSRIAFSSNRRQADNVAAKLLLLEFRGVPVDTKKMHLDRMVKDGIQAEAKAAEFEQATKRVLRHLDLMTSVFSERDALLKSQGPVTVYYWLIRQIQSSEIPRLREFLVYFNSARVDNRIMARHGNLETNQALLGYDILDRSTNDQRSIEGRSNLLLRSFQNWLPTGDLVVL